MQKKIKQNIYNELRKQAASLYSTQAAARYVINSVAMNEGLVDLHGPAVYIWDSLLSHAEDENKLLDVVKFILSEFPDDQLFQQVVASSHDGTAFIEEVNYDIYIKQNNGQATKTFLVYDIQDMTMANALKAQLYPLVLSGGITVSDMYTNMAGLNEQESLKQMGGADIVLLLLTANFFNPDNNCLKLAFTGFEMRKTVVPVLISDSLWGRIQILKNIVPLPIERIPVSQWGNKEEALMKIALGVEEISKRIKR